MTFRPQILTAIIIMGVLGGMVIVLAPTMIDKIVTGIVTGIGMLGMKLLENSEGG
jgi:hypothetical protein|tara:strand:+ start:2389 stop:2553 length:165 start_codon:yes stop_codon:yes gene_type:complete